MKHGPLSGVARGTYSSIRVNGPESGFRGDLPALLIPASAHLSLWAGQCRQARFLLAASAITVSRILGAVSLRNQSGMRWNQGGGGLSSLTPQRLHQRIWAIPGLRNVLGKGHTPTLLPVSWWNRGWVGGQPSLDAVLTRPTNAGARLFLDCRRALLSPASALVLVVPSRQMVLNLEL